MGIKKLVKQVLTEKEDRRYRRLLAKREISYGVWLACEEKRWAEETSEDDACSGGRDRQEDAGERKAEFVLIQACSGEAVPWAQNSIRRYFCGNPSVSALYCDEDVRLESGEYSLPWFKPDWSPDFLDSCLYLGGLVAVRRGLWEERKRFCERTCPGRWQRIFDEKKNDRYEIKDRAEYEKWLHDCLKEGYQRGSVSVGHIPQILFHARGPQEQRRFLEESDYLKEKRRRLLAGFYACHVEGKQREEPVVSVVIPSKDQPDLLRRCVESVKTAGANIPFEIIVVDNGSGADNRAAIESLLREEAAGGMNEVCPRIRYLYRPMAFHFSRMCNLGAENAKGKLLLFLNDDVVLEDGCVQEMAARAVRSYTGAVGIKLLYPETGRIQHAGITNLPMGPVHKLQSMRDDRDYYGKANHSCRNFLAVTAACLMVERQKFTQAGGFCEELPVAFNDVDLCFRLYEMGFHNVCLNDIHAFHYESMSRGDDEAPEKLGRLLGERKRLYERHPRLAGKDPYYSQFLNREGLDVRIAPAYRTAGNRLQEAGALRRLTDMSDYREDGCLMVRVEDIRRENLVGWSVVLGDDNACYCKEFLLCRTGEELPEPAGSQMFEVHTLAEREESSGSDFVYGIAPEEQLRPDLEENMPDQRNVALSGFWIRLTEGCVPRGKYRIGIRARNRVTGLRLVNWSSRTIEL